MDLDQIKSKLTNLQTPTKGGGEKKDYSKIFWSPKVGKHEVRIVPSVHFPENPFKEVQVYYGIGSKKTMISPMNFGEKDPIKEFADALRAEYSKENFALAGKLYPKTRIFVPVIVRGEEEKGVRLWQFGKLIYEQLLSMAVDEEIGDYTDVANGRDMKLETVGPDVTGTAFNKTSIRPKMASSPLSKDKKLVKLWLEEQPEPLSTFTRYSFDEMKTSLQQWLEPEDSDDSEDSEEKEDIKYTPKASKDTVKDKEWNEIFKDDEDEDEDED